MRVLRIFGHATCWMAIVAASSIASAGHRRDLGRETLEPNDGWASFGPGTTGGSAAAPDQVYFVHDRKELVAALNDGIYPPPSSTPSSTPKIIHVVGTIDANVDDNNQPLTCPDYYRENNFFKTDEAITPDQFIERFNGTRIHASGTLVNGFRNRNRVDVVAAWNSVNDPDLATDAGWVPTLFIEVHPAWTVPFVVEALAGPFFWHRAGAP